jgi:hypothetical protein
MSEIKVNKISPRTNCGTVTLGDSGDTFTIPAGATITNNGTASGFGATGSVNWQTTVKTGDFTAVSGEGYFVNTTSGTITVTLPSSPSAGAIVGIKDYAQTFDTNKCTLGRNGSKIGGQAIDGNLSQEGVAVTLVYIDSTQGWLVTDSGLQSDAPTTQYVAATGGTITNSPCGDYKIHTFTGPGTFCVTCAGNSQGSNTVDYLVVAGGGGGGYFYGGGGGAGGARMSSGAASGCYTVGPLGSGVSALPVTASPFPVTVGAGGGGAQTGTPNDPLGYTGINGSNSIFAGTTTITSAGGGGGAGRNGSALNGNAGGSGGGGTNGGTGSTGSGGAGNTPPTTPSQGQPGGQAPPGNGAAGGGATETGGNGGNSPGDQGGDGVLNNINPAMGDPSGGSQYYAGGGNPACGPGLGRSLGGGGMGSKGPIPEGNGLVNTGSGGGGNAATPNSGTGGSGIVIIRYKFQN